MERYYCTWLTEVEDDWLLVETKWDDEPKFGQYTGTAAGTVVQDLYMKKQEHGYHSYLSITAVIYALPPLGRW